MPSLYRRYMNTPCLSPFPPILPAYNTSLCWYGWFSVMSAYTNPSPPYTRCSKIIYFATCRIQCTCACVAPFVNLNLHIKSLFSRKLINHSFCIVGVNPTTIPIHTYTARCIRFTTLFCFCFCFPLFLFHSLSLSLSLVSFPSFLVTYQLYSYIVSWAVTETITAFLHPPLYTVRTIPFCVSSFVFFFVGTLI